VKVVKARSLNHRCMLGEDDRFMGCLLALFFQITRS
jgi:hypothetical protein